jgi:hypothetical protein
MALSEPGFLFFSLAGLFLAVVYACSLRPAVLAMAAGALGLAWLSRYAGAVGVAAAAVLLLVRGGRWRDRFFRAGALVAVASLPMAGWMIRNVTAGATATSRNLAWHPGLGEFLQGAGVTVANWIAPRWLLHIPDRWTCVLLIPVAVGLFWSVVRAARAKVRARPGLGGRRATMCLILGLVVAAYGPTLVVARAAFDRGIPFNERILSPWLLLGLLLGSLEAYSLWEMTRRSRVVAAGALLGCCGLLMVRTWNAVDESVALSASGQGYHRTGWRASPTVRALEDLPPGALIYSNAPDAIYLLTGRDTLSLPAKVHFAAPQPDSLDPVLSDFEEKLNGGGLIVYFKRIGTRSGRLPGQAELERWFRLRIVTRTSDGVIYAADQAGDYGSERR